jgi:large subunit ribosomal protein L9
MQIILLQDVEKIGLRGEVVDVARGYARNFLIPRQLAEPASAARVAEIEKRAARRARQEASTFEQARELAAKLEQTELRFDVKAGPTGSLFGSVTPTDLADELWKVAKIRVDRRKIDLPDPIKRVGRYEVPVELFTDVTATVRTVVVPEGGELPAEEAVSETPAEAPEAEAPVSDASPAAETEEPEPAQ